VDNPDFLKWIKCFADWLFSAQLFLQASRHSLVATPLAPPRTRSEIPTAADKPRQPPSRILHSSIQFHRQRERIALDLLPALA
jgi:hypothetical protein